MRNALAGIALAVMLTPAVVVGMGTVSAEGASQGKQVSKAQQIRKNRAAHVRWAAKQLPACKYEDSRNCYWNAGTSGNGVGRSFIDLDGCVFYLDGRLH